MEPAIFAVAVDAASNNWVVVDNIVEDKLGNSVEKTAFSIDEPAGRGEVPRSAWAVDRSRLIARV
jgi:hypothetical protein